LADHIGTPPGPAFIAVGKPTAKTGTNAFPGHFPVKCLRRTGA